MVVDDHPVFRQGLVLALARVPGLRVAYETGDPVRALHAARELAPDLAIIDVTMPAMSGVSLASGLREASPACCVVALSAVGDPGVIADMLDAGARAYLQKTQPMDEIVQGLREALGGTPRTAPSPPGLAARDALLARLTAREREVFELVIRGFATLDIADRFCISPRTVETHRLRLYRKLSARSISELQRIAARFGDSS